MQHLAQWRERILPLIETLKKAGGTTEDEFLQIGARLQEFYIKSEQCSRLANQLVGLLGDDEYHVLIGALQRMIDEMDEYLLAARTRSNESRETLGRVLELLHAASQPLEGFQNMQKTLRMLGISTKIESARLGELGSGFTILAADVERLSCQVNEKTGCIVVQLKELDNLIVQNLQGLKTNELLQDAEISAMLAIAMTSFQGLTDLNNRCSHSGEVAGRVAGEVAASISEVVSSVQTHDSVRQQLEHATEALGRLVEEIGTAAGTGDSDETIRGLVSKSGDICELQVAQVRYAGRDLYNAVVTIIKNLNAIGAKQSLFLNEITTATGAGGTSGDSHFSNLRKGLGGAGAALGNCAGSDQKLFVTLLKVAETTAGISSFVGAIEEIGAEINLLALNAQIKAAHTGKDGAALGILAEAIKRLALEAVTQADAMSHSLSSINSATETLVTKARGELTSLGERVRGMDGKVDEIVSSLECLNQSTSALLVNLIDNVQNLNGDINQSTSSIKVHDTIEELTSQVTAGLDEIVTQARARVPASTEFFEDLQHMTSRYTMQSERRIHDEIARTKKGQTEIGIVPTLVLAESHCESEFGDNVDLF
ncbi:MAG TPA: methyl-accepting chemotaxis protein [Desulfuromonadaceae bacterium]|jgi:methyl-accepting chemotaxis protein